MQPEPARGRVYRSRRRVRLSDMDAGGRLRLDAVARYLQDVATDDVAETGWGAPEHLWVVRKMRVDVVAPVAGDAEVELTTWCSAVGGSAAGRRTTIAGGGGRIETDSVWIHVERDGRPARIDPAFMAVYADAADGRRVSTRFDLLDPPPDAQRIPWQVRAADLDVMAHVNNAVYWAAVEEVLARRPGLAAAPLGATLEYRRPIDLGEHVELAETPTLAGFSVAFVAGGTTRAVAAVDRP